jgi:NADP-dependent 3-hydroxy acid dehydrogenase YdfG
MRLVLFGGRQQKRKRDGSIQAGNDVRAGNDMRAWNDMHPEDKMTEPLQPLKRKTVLITGASSGIGWATALVFARAGAKVVVTARRQERLAALCEAIAALGAEAASFAGDAAVARTAQAAVALAQERFGALDILINNAGQGNYKNLVETSAEDYDALMNANMRSGFLFSRYAVPGMVERRSGVVLFISSVAGLQGAAGEAVYSATKFAQAGFAQSLDAELRQHGIKVGTIFPGGVKTEFALGAGRSEEFIRNSRMMDPAEVAEAILFAATLPPNVRIPQLTIRHMG